MDMGNLNLLFGIIGVGFGLYSLYSLYMMRTKGEINTTLLLPKDVEVRKCKNKEAYIKEASLPLVIVAIGALFYGGVELFHDMVQPVGSFLLVSVFTFFATLVWFSVMVVKLRKKYF